MWSALVNQLRPGTPEDVPAVQSLEAAARVRYLGIQGLEFVAAAAPIADECIRNGELVVTEQDGRLIGFVLTNVVDGLLFVTNISVEPASSGQGVGAELIRATLAKAEALGLDAVALTTFRSPPWNAAWFARFGFEPMPDERIGAGLREIRARQARSVDPSTRAVLWLRVGIEGSGIAIKPYRQADHDATIDIFLRAIREIAAKDYNPSQIEAWAQVDRGA
jgi:N-acetylglutamate synthase-like GNAT family acetyltransferase